jgi:hypothetical protein
VLSPSRALQLLSSFHSRASPTATAACYLLFSPYCAPPPLCFLPPQPSPLGPCRRPVPRVTRAVAPSWPCPASRLYLPGRGSRASELRFPPTPTAPSSPSCTLSNPQNGPLECCSTPPRRPTGEASPCVVPLYRIHFFSPMESTQRLLCLLQIRDLVQQFKQTQGVFCEA